VLSSVVILVALSLVSCAGAIVRPVVAPAPSPADALLVMPGFGYGRGGETALKALAQTVAAEGDGRWREYVGGYSDWLRQRPQPRIAAPAKSAAEPETSAPAAIAKKLSYKEQRELESLPAEIEKLEAEQQALTQKMGGADYHRVVPDEMRRDGERAVELETLISQRMERWVSLEERA
jgi:ATP-binding cassette subfamily F protein uup